jgi:long-subunit acyl-CoA synthetase (AMP-forming)
VFKGYWNEQDLTDDMVDADGWYMTGMLGETLPNGTLKLLGKK